MEQKYKNRSSFVSNTDKQYLVSSVQTISNDKKDWHKELAFTEINQSWKKQNLITLANKNQLKNFLTQNIIKIATQKNSELKLNKDNAFADFVYFDFDNKEATEKYFSYDDCLKILKSSKYNYILITSKSHTEERNKFHVLIPTLRKINENYIYKHYRHEIGKILFNERLEESDKMAAHISSNMFPADKETCRLDYRFDYEDIFFDTTNIKVFLKQTSKAPIDRNGKEIISKELNNDALNIYGQQVQNMYGFITVNDKSNSNSIQFKRDVSDNHAMLFTYLQGVDYAGKWNVIFDSNRKSNNKSKAFNTLFTYNDFVTANKAEEIRTELQSKLKDKVDHFLSDVSHNLKSKRKHYLITNEGLGKSTSVLHLGTKYKFIYLTHTNSKMLETIKELESKNISFSKILGIKYFLIENNETKLATEYEEYAKKENDDESHINFNDFLSTMEVQGTRKRELLRKYKINNKKFFSDSNVVVMTMKKLMVILTGFQKKQHKIFGKHKLKNLKIERQEIKLDYIIENYERNIKELKLLIEEEKDIDSKERKKKDLKRNKRELDNLVFTRKVLNDKRAIIFDEFNRNDWYRYNTKNKSDDNTFHSIHNLFWGNGNTDNGERVSLHKQDNFIELLDSKSVLILSTERRILEDVFYAYNYNELNYFESSLFDDWGEVIDDKEMSSFDIKLHDSDIVYILTTSTSKLDNRLKNIATYLGNEFNVNTIISNTLKKEDFSNKVVYSHLAVRGENSFSNKDMLIFGNLKNESELLVHIENCKNKYEKVFNKEIQAINDKFLRLGMEDKFTNSELDYIRGKEIRKLFENRTQEVLLESEVSQSIGRNSGFRGKGKRTYVVLPILVGGTNSTISKKMNLNYVSENVICINFENTKNDVKMTKFHSNFSKNLDSNMLNLLKKIEMQKNVEKKRIAKKKNSNEW